MQTSAHNRTCPLILATLPLLCLLLSSCEETVSGTEIDLPYKREIVVQGFLTAGEVDTILILQTVHPLEPWTIEKGAITDAEVTMTVNGQERRMRHVQGGRYVADGWVPEPGSEYHLRVKSGEEVVTAVAKVPDGEHRSLSYAVDTVSDGCTWYDWETGSEYQVGLIRFLLYIANPNNVRFQVRYDMVETYVYEGDTLTQHSRDMRAYNYEYPGDGTAIAVLREFCRYQGFPDGVEDLNGIDSVYLQIFEFEPAYTKYYETEWRDNDDEFFGPSGSEPAWNVSGDGFGWFFGRSVMLDTIGLR